MLLEIKWNKDQSKADYIYKFLCQGFKWLKFSEK